MYIMRGSRTFFKRGAKFDDVFFLVDKGIEDTNTAINGPSSARQRNAINETPLKWRFAGGPMVAQH